MIFGVLDTRKSIMIYYYKLFLLKVMQSFLFSRTFNFSFFVSVIALNELVEVVAELASWLGNQRESRALAM